MRFISNQLCRLVVSAVLLTGTALQAKATTDPVVTMPLKGSENKVIVNMESYARDTKYFSLSQANKDSIKNNSIVNMVGVGIEELNTMYIPGNFSVKVTLQITGYDKNEMATGTTTKLFTINYDTATGAKYRSFEDTVFANAYAVRVKILSIDSGSINWPVSKVLKVENQLTATRDYYFDCNLAISGLTDSLFVANDELTAYWQQFSLNTNPGVTEYDLEWAWIDEGALDNYKSGSNYSQDLLFSNNATRVSISGSLYNIPLLYDDTGRIFIRVRPVQLRTDGQRVEGKWTWITNDANQPVLSANPLFYSYYGHEDKLNWQASTSFAEEGKRKSVVQYFDGSLRSRQTVTKDNTSNTTIVAESFYDYQGRPVVQVLPAPTLNNAIGYAHNFNRAVGEDIYSKSDYDKLVNGASVCGNPAKPFNTDFGTANYYSAKNPMLATDALSKYIPDATAGNPNEAYAFTETRFNPDGRVAAQGGVGITHQIGSNHETKYFYETPAQEELDALFGTDAGIASHYFKNIVKDANGQYSVSYTDMHNRTIATALAGETPKNADGSPMLDPLESMNDAPFTKQLLDNETNLIVGNSIISSKPFVVLKDNSTYSFDYNLAPKQLSLLSCTGQPICYDCLYQLKFTISSDCDQQLVYIDSSTNFTLGQYLNQCNNGNANQGFIKHFEKILNQGSYTVTKTLTLSSDAQDHYRDVFIANDTCRRFIDFYTQELSVLQANSNCNMACESCKASIGEGYNGLHGFAGFRAKFVAESNTPEPLPASVVVQLQAAYNEAYANCDRMCDNNDGFDLVRSTKQMMLQDVTPPYGQYARLNDNTQSPPVLSQNFSYNIFKFNDGSNVLEGYGGSPATPDYKRPMKFTANDATLLTLGQYYDEFDQQETINVSSLTPEQFVDSFKTSWANQLLVHHPEFKKLQLSENQLLTTYQFEANLEKDSTWAQAASHNYITGLVNLDPFFNGVAPSSYKIRMMGGYYNGSVSLPPTIDVNTNPVIHGINNFILPHTTSPCANAPQYADDPVSMWQVALATVYCREKANGPACSVDYSDPNTKAGCTMNSAYYQPQNNFSEGCASDRDWAWKIFKNLYLAERRKLISAYLNTNAPTFSATYPNNSVPPYQLRFINHANPQSTFNNTGINGAGDIGDIITAVGNDINGGTGQAQTLAQAQYDTVCRGYANTWIAQLRSCPQINDKLNDLNTWVADSTWLVDRLRGICRRGADENHFLGSSSVSPANYNTFVLNGVTFNEFPDVVKEFLATRIAPPINATYTAECYPWLISVPKPYDKQPALANSYVLAKPSPCECERIGNLRSEWQQSGFAGTFSAYLQYKYGTTISNDQLDALTALCNGTYACHMLEKPVPLPPALQCPSGNPPAKTCISCQDYAAIKNDFFVISNQHAPFAHPQNQTEVAYNYFFASYANHRTGFSKTWAEYVAFENACASVNPSIDCTTFNSLVDGFYNQYGVQIFKNGNCLSLFVNYINTQLGSNYTFAQLETMYHNSCGGECGLNICDFPNHFLLTKVYNAFKLANPQPWNLPDCQQAFVDFFNNYFDLTPAVTWTDLTGYYPLIDRPDCIPDLYSLCTQPFDCGPLEKIRAKFISIYDPNTQPDCQQAFADFFNSNMGTNYTYAQIAAIYWNNCNIMLDVCGQAPDCDSMIELWTNYLASLCPPPTEFPPHPCDYDCTSLNSNFVALFNTTYGTSYTTFAELHDLYLGCNYDLQSPCGNGKDPKESPSPEGVPVAGPQPAPIVNPGGGGGGGGTIDLPPMLCGLNDPSGGPVPIDTDPCKDLPKIAFHLATEKYELYVDSLRNVFDTAYHNKCMAAKDLESFTMTYRVSEYHYTLYYYDQAGNLVKTVPPAGVNRIANADLINVKNARAAGTKYPVGEQHSMITQYRYNTLNKVVAQITPDAGISKFYFDRLGRLAISQNAKQAADGNYSYILYDYIGRIKEAGQKPNNQPMSQATSQSQTALGTWFSGGGTKEQITGTVYDDAYTPLQVSTAANGGFYQKNLRNRISYTFLKNIDNTTDPYYTWNAATLYSYDIHGNADTLLQDYGSSQSPLSANVMNSAGGNRWKRLVYKYDLISGKVNEVAYQPGQTDAFYHRYNYDAENRLTDVETSSDKIIWEKEARYNYYKHGPLARTVLGELQVQGVDYAYTLEGWLKGINSTSVGDGSFDIGGDGRTGNPNSNIARDVYGFSLSYFTGDYKAISNTVLPFAVINTGNDLFNSNIKATALNIPKLGSQLTYIYKYDQLNRLTAMDAYSGLNNTTNIFTPVTIQDYKERVSYDPNGNIKTYKRNGDAARLNMDDMTYSYKPGTNQLDKVSDAATDAAAGQYDNYRDIKQGQQNGNYTYDAIGNLITDPSEGITNINWNVYGKIKNIAKAGGAIEYTYDAAGNRISKVSNGKTTYYVRDASGNVMSIYETGSANSGALTQTELDMYGSSRLGIYNVSKNVQVVSPPVTVYERGNKSYELSNHLLNVLVTVSDKRIAHSSNGTAIDYYEADVISAQDFYPFGFEIPGRRFNSNKATYGFNGKRKDNEIYGEGNAYDFGERIQDPRLGGRWFSVDPLAGKMQGWSPYSFAFNSPISHADYKGLYPILTVTNEITGYTAIKVYGKTGNPTLIVPTYKAVLKDVTNGKTTILGTYNVTRDGYYNIGSKKNEIKLEDRSFEPKKEVKYTAVKFDYVEGTPALALRQNGSTKLDATPLKNHTYTDGTTLPKDIDRKDPDIATGVMIHIGGAYKHKDGTVSLGGTYGCMGVVSSSNVYNTKAAAQQAVNDGSFMTITSNATMTDLSKKMDDSNAKDPAPNKIEVVVKKRRK